MSIACVMKVSQLKDAGAVVWFVVIYLLLDRGNVDFAKALLVVGALLDLVVAMTGAGQINVPFLTS